MNPIDEFRNECRNRIVSYAEDEQLQSASHSFMDASTRAKYSYNFSWLGRPIIQYPQDIVAMQEIIWKVKPEIIVETGVAHGGSLSFYASMLQLLGGDGVIVGIDVDIRTHNRHEIEKHPLFGRMRLIEGSSVDQTVVNTVKGLCTARQSVMVVLDSNHTHDHVLRELRLYAPLVTVGSYCVVFDTIIEDVPDGTYSDRPWGKGNNPKTAVLEFLKENPRFVVDEEMRSKLLISVASDGYLRRVR
jgi:cephalosporin hydroxylase